MKKMVKEKNLEASKSIVRWANVVLVWMCLEIIHLLVVFKLMAFSWVSPLIPQQVSYDMYGMYVDAALIVSIGFLPCLILKLYKRNLWTAVFGTLTLIIIHVFTWLAF